MDNYTINFEVANKMEIYDFKKLFERKEDFYKFINENINTRHDRFITHCLEFGNIDIELNVEIDSDYKNGYCLSFYSCTKNSEGIWESYDFCDNGNVEKIVSENYDQLEKEMYKQLMKFAKENNLYWSKGNDFN